MKLFTFCAAVALAHTALFAQAPVITERMPLPATTAAVSTANISITWNTALSSATVTSPNFIVRGRQSGAMYSTNGTITLSTAGTVVTIDPANSFKVGEEIFVTVTSAVRSTSGTQLGAGQTWSFRAEAPVGYGFLLATSTTLPLSGWSTAFGDIDNDGDVDVVRRANSGPPQKVFKNDGNGNFTFHQDLTGGEVRNTMVDIDNDGDLDIMTFFASNAKVFENDGQGNYTQIHEASSSSLENDIYLGIGINDFNGDGYMDVFNANTIYINNRNKTFTAAVIPGITKIAAGDFNGDGYTDIFGTSLLTVSVLMNDGNGNFIQGQTASYGADPYELLPFAADFDGDGDIDVFVNYSYANPSFMMVNDGSGNFTEQAINQAIRGVCGIADINADGRLDIVYSNDSDYNIYISLNNGGMSFSTPIAFAEHTGILLEHDFADIDGDGSLEYMWAGMNSQDKPALFVNGMMPTGVINTNAAGPGSLRFALENASPGDTISFANGLQGQTFTITGSLIVVSNRIYINFGSARGGITIDSGNLPALQLECGALGSMLSGVRIVSAHPSGGVVSNCAGVQGVVVDTNQP